MVEKRNMHQIITLTNMIDILKNNLQNTVTDFDQKIKLYGIINYSRTQYFPELSSYITENKEYSDIFFDYTSVESMILDLFSVIESDLVLILEDSKQYDDEKMTKLIDFSLKLLKILEKILKAKYEKLAENIDDEEYQQLKTEYAGKLYNLQNEFYRLIYDEKIDSRIR